LTNPLLISQEYYNKIGGSGRIAKEKDNQTKITKERFTRAKDNSYRLPITDHNKEQPKEKLADKQD